MTELCYLPAATALRLFRSRELSPVELAEAVIEITGSGSEIIYEALPTDDPQQRRPDITLAREILDWEPTIELREGLQRTIDQSGREALVGADPAGHGAGPRPYDIETTFCHE